MKISRDICRAAIEAGINLMKNGAEGPTDPSVVASLREFAEKATQVTFGTTCIPGLGCGCPLYALGLIDDLARPTYPSRLSLRAAGRFMEGFDFHLALWVRGDKDAAGVVEIEP